MSDISAINNTRILFWGIQRSGNHALINWIMAQYKEPKMFLNNQPFGSDLISSPEDPLSTLGKEHHRSPRVFYAQKREENWQEIWGSPKGKLNELLLISYENHDLNKITELEYQRGCEAIGDSVVGNSLNTINVVIIRDPFNMWTRDMPDPPKPQDPELWKVYAREYLNETNILPNKVSINFNRWFSNKEYRRGISNQLGVSFSDDGLNKVSKAGGGSSYDRTKFDQNAQAMKVLNRWEQSRNFLKKRRLLRTLKRDSEMLRLVETIYPSLHSKWNRISLNNFWYFYS